MIGLLDSRWLRRAACGAAACGFLMAMPVAQAQDWPMGGQNLNNGRNQPVTTITAGNAANLHQKWVFTAGGNIQATPAVVNGVVYFPDLAGNFYALDATTGSLKWQQIVQNWTGIAGDYARHDPAVAGNVVVLGNQWGAKVNWFGSYQTPTCVPTALDMQALNCKPGASVMAVNASTGALIWVTQVESFPAAMVTSSPVIYNNVVYVGVATSEEGTAVIASYPCCISRGSVVALDLNTGKILWKTYTVPDNGGITGFYSGGSVWGSTPVVDAKRNSLYVGVGNNFTVPIADEVCAAKNPAKNCYAKDDYFDSLLSLDLTTGAVKWATHAWPYDAWNVNCIENVAPPTFTVTFGPGPNCPTPHGPDYDFGGSGPNMFTRNSGNDDLIGIGQKSGIYWAINANSGAVVWNTQVGPGSSLGGIEWGTATDGTHIYVPISNAAGSTYAPPSTLAANGGSWAALDPKNGNILWQTATPGSCLSPVTFMPAGCMALGAVSVAGGVVFGGSMDKNIANPTMFAMDASSGAILWSFAAGSPVVAAPAIVGDSVYWGSGPTAILAGPGLGFPSNNKLYAFTIH
jgi:polyvinyl alcohol dehydrogenase (cytochrome)